MPKKVIHKLTDNQMKTLVAVERAKAVTDYLLASALTYSRFARSGVDVVKDMLRSGGITKEEIYTYTKDRTQRTRLMELLRD